MCNDPIPQPTGDLPFAKPYPVSYSSFTGARRPGILTAVAIFDIILASLALPCNVSQLTMMNVMRLSTAPRIVGAAPGIAPSVSAGTSASGEFIARNGLSANQRQLVIDALARARPLSEARRQQAEAILADAGHEMIRLSPEYLSADRLDAYVTEVRSIPDPAGGPPADLFVLGSGSLQLDDQSAVFRADGENSSITTRDGNCTDSSGTHLGALQIGAVIAQVQKLSNNSLTTAQKDLLATELRVPGQTLIMPHAPAAQIISAQKQPDGSIQITTQSGSFTASPDGAQSGISTSSGATFSYVSSAQFVVATPWHTSRSAALVFDLDALGSLLCSIALLIFGILLLMNSFRSRQLHMLYAIAKIVLTLLVLWAAYWVGWRSTIVWYAVGAIYPIILLITMTRPSVREFFATRTVGQI